MLAWFGLEDPVRAALYCCAQVAARTRGCYGGVSDCPECLWRSDADTRPTEQSGTRTVAAITTVRGVPSIDAVLGVDDVTVVDSTARVERVIDVLFAPERTKACRKA